MTESLTISSSNNISTDPSILRVNFPSGSINFKDKEIALLNANLYYSWYSISAGYNNNKFTYTLPTGVSYNVIFPDGFYTTVPNDNLNGYFQNVQLLNGHYLIDNNGNNQYYMSITQNSNFYRSQIICTQIPISLPTGWTDPGGFLTGNAGFVPQITILSDSVNQFDKVIGFVSGTYPSASHTTTTYQVLGSIAPQITPVNLIQISCNLVCASQFNKYQNTLYTFPPNTGYGSLISSYPAELSWFPLSNGSFGQMVINLYDQNGLPIIQQDPTNTVLTFLIRNILKNE